LADKKKLGLTSMLLAAHPYAGGSSVCLVVQKSENLIPSVFFFLAFYDKVPFQEKKNKHGGWVTN
jgi:hypothetical protein